MIFYLFYTLFYNANREAFMIKKIRHYSSMWNALWRKSLGYIFSPISDTQTCFLCIFHQLSCRSKFDRWSGGNFVPFHPERTPFSPENVTLECSCVRHRKHLLSSTGAHTHSAALPFICFAKIKDANQLLLENRSIASAITYMEVISRGSVPPALSIFMAALNIVYFSQPGERSRSQSYLWLDTFLSWFRISVGPCQPVHVCNLIFSNMSSFLANMRGELFRTNGCRPNHFVKNANVIDKCVYILFGVGWFATRRHFGIYLGWHSAAWSCCKTSPAIHCGLLEKYNIILLLICTNEQFYNQN